MDGGLEVEIRLDGSERFEQKTSTFLKGKAVNPHFTSKQPFGSVVVAFIWVLMLQLNMWTCTCCCFTAKSEDAMIKVCVCCSRDCTHHLISVLKVYFFFSIHCDFKIPLYLNIS